MKLDQTENQRRVIAPRQRLENDVELIQGEQHVEQRPARLLGFIACLNLGGHTLEFWAFDFVRADLSQAYGFKEGFGLLVQPVLSGAF